MEFPLFLKVCVAIRHAIRIIDAKSMVFFLVNFFILNSFIMVKKNGLFQTLAIHISTNVPILIRY